MKLFDAHCHLTDSHFDCDRDYLINDLENFGVGYCMNASENLESSKKAISLSEKYKNIYVAVGFHPENVGEFSETSLDELKLLTKNNNVKAIGEIGLDYYYTKDNKDIQKEVFIRQLDMACELDMPVVIHTRDATKDTLDILKSYKDRIICQMHCFPESKEILKEYLKLNFMISMGGVLTYKNSVKAKEVIEYIPIENLLLETDSPYLTPEPFRGYRNDPRRLIFVAMEVAKIKNMKIEKIIKHTTNNALRFFRI